MVSTEAEETPVQDLPSSRAEAKRLGFKHYFTGKPCKRGHVASRYATSRGCMLCAREQALRYARENPDVRRERLKRWKKNNPERAREQIRRYRRKHPERARERSRQWYRHNRQSHRKSVLRWGANNPERVKEHGARRRAARLQRIPCWADRDKVQSVYDKAQRLTEETGVQYHVDHVYPLRGEIVSGLHVAENLQVVPATVNLSKLNKHPEEVET